MRNLPVSGMLHAPCSASRPNGLRRRVPHLGRHVRGHSRRRDVPAAGRAFRRALHHCRHRHDALRHRARHRLPSTRGEWGISLLGITTVVLSNGPVTGPSSTCRHSPRCWSRARAVDGLARHLRRARTSLSLRSRIGPGRFRWRRAVVLARRRARMFLFAQPVARLGAELVGRRHSCAQSSARDRPSCWPDCR